MNSSELDDALAAADSLSAALARFVAHAAELAASERARENAPRHPSELTGARGDSRWRVVQAGYLGRRRVIERLAEDRGVVNHWAASAIGRACGINNAQATAMMSGEPVTAATMARVSAWFGVPTDELFETVVGPARV